MADVNWQVTRHPVDISFDPGGGRAPLAVLVVRELDSAGAAPGPPVDLRGAWPGCRRTGRVPSGGQGGRGCADGRFHHPTGERDGGHLDRADVGRPAVSTYSSRAAARPLAWGN